MATKQVRAAVVGATSVLAKELLEELNSSRTAAWDIRLLAEAEDEEVQLATAGEEAVLIQPLSREAIEGMDFVFFAGDATTARTLADVARQTGAAIVDLTGALVQEQHFLLRCPWLQGGQRPDLTTVGMCVPQPAAIMLALVAQRLQETFGLRGLSATVLEPASQAGKAGLDELHQQTVSLLSLQSVPKEVYDAQVAFNLQTALGEAAKISLEEVSQTIRQHLSGLLGAPLGQVPLQVVQAPVFHGYTISALATLEREADPAAVRAALQGGLVQATDDTVPSNAAVVESGDILVAVSQPESQAGRSCWLWMAADNLRLHARCAVAAALELASLRPTGTQ